MFADNASTTAVSGKCKAHAPISTLPRTATTGASSLNFSRIFGSPTSPACTINSEPRSASSASSRSKPCVSEISPMRPGSLGVDSAGVTPSGYYRRNAPGLQRGNFGRNLTTQRLGTGNRKGHVPEVRLGGGKLQGHVFFPVARPADGHNLPFYFFPGDFILELQNLTEHNLQVQFDGSSMQTDAVRHRLHRKPLANFRVTTHSQRHAQHHTNRAPPLFETKVNYRHRDSFLLLRPLISELKQAAMITTTRQQPSGKPRA